MEILILGDSNTRGTATGGVSWPEMLRESLEPKLGEPVTVRNTALFVTGPESLQFVEKRLAEGPVDIAIVALGTYAFTARFVHLHVEKLFGKRVAEWYRRGERGFESGTRGKPGGRDRLNSWARTALRRTVGTAAMAGWKDVAEGYLQVFRRLARMEDLAVIVMTYPGTATHSQAPAARRDKERFFAVVKPAAEAHHFGWVEGREIFAGVGDMSALYSDGLHFQEAGQRLFADAFEREILALRARER